MIFGQMYCTFIKNYANQLEYFEFLIFYLVCDKKIWIQLEHG
jgi:hypothetical protein